MEVDSLEGTSEQSVATPRLPSLLAERVVDRLGELPDSDRAALRRVLSGLVACLLLGFQGPQRERSAQW
jgi:hypothetical protein